MSSFLLAAGLVSSLLKVQGVWGASNPFASPDCSVDSGSKIDCGHVGTKQADCEAAGCCWRPVKAKEAGVQDTPWCFHPKGPVPGKCGKLTFNATDPGFTSSFYDAMYANFVKQINIDGSGAVVAAPDHNTPGGSYYFHWMRDAALSTRVYQEINDQEYDKVHEVMDAYTSWVQKVQAKLDPNQIDVRIEPKFTIPDGNPFTGGWCRPQTDGPALRAHSLTIYANTLVGAGKQDRAKSVVWPLIAHDLEWVTSNWGHDGCDLWEEVRSSDFFWNRMGYVQSLTDAAKLASVLKTDASLVQRYQNTAKDIQQTLEPSHWNGNYVVSASNRPIDGSVLHAIVSFPNDGFFPLSPKTAKTITHYNQIFCQEYPVNKVDDDSVQGILYGRYPGDSYAGGNPWPLLSASLAETFYAAGKAVLTKFAKEVGHRRARALGENQRLADVEMQVESVLRSELLSSEWPVVLPALKKELLRRTSESSVVVRIAEHFRNAGDSVMSRIWQFVKDDGGRIDEQINKNSGSQASAKSLTWSYANLLHAIKERRALTTAIDEKKANTDDSTVVVL